MPAEDLITQVQNPDEIQKDTKHESDSLCLRFCCCCCIKPAPQSVPPQQQKKQQRATQPPVPGDGLEPQGQAQQFLLPPLDEKMKHMKCLVLDLDETLVHSSFKPIPDPDFNIEIELEGQTHRVYVRKRPGVDFFLQEAAKKFEIVIFTASLAKYADPLLDELDKDGVVQFRLFRQACVQHYGNYVKDLTSLGRALESSIIIDNSPFSYMFQPDNAIPITSWFNDKSDRQLYDLLPFLDTLAVADDVVQILQKKSFGFLTNPQAAQ